MQPAGHPASPGACFKAHPRLDAGEILRIFSPMLTKKSLFAALFAVAAACPAYPWDGQGHAAIGLVAEQRLNAEARRHIEKILGNCDLASIASWMDDVRGATNGFGRLASNTEARKFAEQFPKNGEWHYVDLPLGEDQYRDNDPFSRPDDVVHEVNVAIQVLEGKSSVVSRKIAVYMIVHFVGDEHQPLHVACGHYDLSNPANPVLITDPKAAVGKEDDRGANDLSFGSARFDELHAYWDGALGKKIAGSPEAPALAKKLMDAIEPKAWASSGDHHAWAEAWATESIIAARKAFEGIKFGKAELQDGKLRRIPITLPANYDAVAVPLARERLAKAGFHLAELLNSIDWPAQG